MAMKAKGVTGVGHVLRTEAEAGGEEVAFGVEVAVGGEAGWGGLWDKIGGGYGGDGCVWGKVVGGVGGCRGGMEG